MRYLTPVLFAAAAASILGTAPAYADLGDQVAKLLADDSASDDQFGVSVAITPDGTGAIVGAWKNDDNGNNSGSAYLFDISDPANPTQIAKLLPDDGEEFDAFGYSVAISGATAIVGAWQDDDNGSDSGSAYLFDTTTGRQIAKLLPDDGAECDYFGWTVAISGATAIVGAYRDDDNDFSGSAYLFDSATGRQITKLLSDDGASSDNFGFSVAISGATAIVGANGNFDNGPFSGSAYLFDISNPANPTQLFKLLADDGAKGDRFGSSVSISPDGIGAIVGAHRNDDNEDASGSAYLFDTTTGQQIFKLLPDDGAFGDEFGISVAISGATAIVGAWNHGDNGFQSGSAYLFDTTTGRQIAKLLADDGAAEDYFGYSVAISGTAGKATAIVGAWFDDDDDNGPDSGSAYLLDAAAPGMCPWDIDGSGNVGASDLLSLLVSWGPCKGCDADFDENGNVGASDLLALLANWGPCP